MIGNSAGASFQSLEVHRGRPPGRHPVGGADEGHDKARGVGIVGGMKRNFSILVAAVFAVVCRADTLEPAAGPAVDGFFLSYDKGKFNFMNRQQKTVHEVPSGVKKLTLDKPLKAEIESKTKRGDKDQVLLKGFEQGSFLVVRNGKEEKIPLMLISVLRVDAMANNRTTDQLGGGADVISKGEEVDLSKAVEQGKVTVVQFHLPGWIASEREGNYLSVLQRRNKDKMDVKRVVVPDVSAPVAKQYQIATLPQFWFYNKSGQFVTKLTDRFTESDIDAALKKASK